MTPPSLAGQTPGKARAPTRRHPVAAAPPSSSFGRLTPQGTAYIVKRRFETTKGATPAMAPRRKQRLCSDAPMGQGEAAQVLRPAVLDKQVLTGRHVVVTRFAQFLGWMAFPIS
jgi:hypothetical protein